MRVELIHIVTYTSSQPTKAHGKSRNAYATRATRASTCVPAVVRDRIVEQYSGRWW